MWLISYCGEFIVEVGAVDEGCDIISVSCEILVA